MNALVTGFTAVFADISQAGVHCALVGGLAVSARAEPRMTRDVDLAVAVEDGREAERAIAMLVARGYHIRALVE